MFWHQTTIPKQYGIFVMLLELNMTTDLLHTFGYCTMSYWTSPTDPSANAPAVGAGSVLFYVSLTTCHGFRQISETDQWCSKSKALQASSAGDVDLLVLFSQHRSHMWPCYCLHRSLRACGWNQDYCMISHSLNRMHGKLSVTCNPWTSLLHMPHGKHMIVGRVWCLLACWFSMKFFSVEAHQHSFSCLTRLCIDRFDIVVCLLWWWCTPLQPLLRGLQLTPSAVQRQPAPLHVRISPLPNVNVYRFTIFWCTDGTKVLHASLDHDDKRTKCHWKASRTLYVRRRRNYGLRLVHWSRTK